MLIGAAFAAFVFYDLQAGVPLRSIAWFIPADTIQVLIATLCLKHFFGGVPQLDSVRSLTRYLFFAVILAPFVAAFVSAPGIGTDYWHGWRICFFSDVLSFLTLTTAILNWISNGHACMRKSRLYQMEAGVLIIGLALVSYLSFAAPAEGSSPALLYSLVPFLLWSALRFGSTGVSSAILVVVFLSIWGAVHGRGPFVERVPLQNVFPIQLFLIFSATPFLVLAALVEERKTDEEALRKGEERLRLAIQAGKMYAFEWNASTDSIVRSSENGQVLGVEWQLPTTGRETFDKVHPDDRGRLFSAFAALNPEKPSLQISHRMVGPDGAVVWVDRAIHAYFDERGRMLRIIGMVADVTERKQAEEELRASEERLRLAQWAAHVGTFDLNLRTGVDTWTPETEALYGVPPGGFGGTLTAFENLIHPDDRQRIIELTHEMMKTGQPTEAEWRVVWPDGSVHWIAGRGQVLMDESGEPSRMLGVNIDITERKRSEEILSGMTRKLIEAQEQERARIARELHDDISQRLAMLAIGLDELRTKHDDLPCKVRGGMYELEQQTKDISADLHALSHELHSSKLEYLGLVRSLRSWCEEFSERQKLEIDFKSHDVQSSPPPNISLCLFRVLQEAVHNAVRHSGARRVEVQLTEYSDEIHLSVSDLGKGFDVEAAKQGQGLGLTSMQERLRLVGGTIVIESKPLAGTTIHVRVRSGQRVTRSGLGDEVPDRSGNRN